mgnify:CR=1 FL=1
MGKPSIIIALPHFTIPDRFAPMGVLLGLLLVLTFATTGCGPKAGSSSSSPGASGLGHGYTRDGTHIRFNGKRIDKEGAGTVADFSVILQHKVKLASSVDAASFKALSEQYTKDNYMVYYSWISGSDFWVVEVPDADPATFEVLGFNIARDKNHVWVEDRKVPGTDPKTARSMANHRVWLDASNVYNYRRIVTNADPKTFKSYGDDYHYHDDKQVYWIFNTFKVVPGADPKTFTP